jgi:hypothetical protein
MAAGTRIRDIAMDTIIVIAIGIQVFMVVDQITDGKLMTELSVRTTKTRAKVKGYFERERTMQRDTGRVIWDAFNIVEDGDNGVDDAGDVWNRKKDR